MNCRRVVEHLVELLDGDTPTPTFMALSTRMSLFYRQ